MFKHTKFLVDRFHYEGHKCSRVFSMDHYPCLKEKKTNSSIIESHNSFLQEFKPQLSQMSQKHFMEFLVHLVRVLNNALQNKLDNAFEWAI